MGKVIHSEDRSQKSINDLLNAEIICEIGERSGSRYHFLGCGIKQTVDVILVSALNMYGFGQII